MRQTIKYIALAMITMLVSTNISFASNSAWEIQSMKALSATEVEMKLKTDIPFVTDSLSWDLKIFKDITAESISRDTENSKKLILKVSSDITAESSYSILSIFWVDGNIDFDLWGEIIGQEIPNKLPPEWDQWIEKIKIVTLRTIEVYFKKSLDESEFEFKIWKKINSSSIIPNNIDKKTISIKLIDNLEANSDYITTISELKSTSGDSITFENWFFDFSSAWANIPVVKWWDKSLEEQLMNKLEWTNTSSNSSIEMNSALSEEIKKLLWESEEETKSWTTSWSWEKEEVRTQLENLALDAKQTPDTWAETWVLILLALWINTGLYLYKKTFRRKIA